MAKLQYKLGTTSVILRVKIQDSTSTTGAGKTGLTFSSAGLIVSTIADNEATATAYTAAGSTTETITTLGTFAAPTATKCRFKEIDATNHPGLYEIQIADARWATASARSIIISVQVTGGVPIDAEVQLSATDPNDGVRAGLTSLPNAAFGTTNGFSCAVVNGGTAQAGAAGSITLAAGASATNSLYVGLQVSIQSGTGAGQSRTITAYVGATKVATVDANWATNPDNTSVYQVSVDRNPAMDANLATLSQSGTGTGQISLAAGLVTVGTNNDKAGYALTSGERTSVADALLDRDMSTGADSGSPTVRTVRQALRFLRNKWSVSGVTMTVTKEDDTAASWTTTVGTTPGANPITSSDPA